METIKRFGQNTRTGCFANAARAAKQVSLRQMLVLDRVFEGLGN